MNEGTDLVRVGRLGYHPRTGGCVDGLPFFYPILLALAGLLEMLDGCTTTNLDAWFNVLEAVSEWRRKTKRAPGILLK